MLYTVVSHTPDSVTYRNVSCVCIVNPGEEEGILV